MRNAGEDTASQLAPLWARKWLILATALAVAVATYAYYARKPPVYLSGTRVLLGVNTAEEILRGQPTELTERALHNQAALLSSQEFAAIVRRRLARTGHPNLAPFAAHVTGGGDVDLLT